MELINLTKIKNRTTGRISSWDKKGGNNDYIIIQPNSTVTIADIKGPGIIKHIWMTQNTNLRNCLIKITWDDSDDPSVICPIGDFFGLGHSITTSYQSLLFSASTNKESENKFDQFTALNCYVPMPYKKNAKIELINESDRTQMQYFYIDYENVSLSEIDGCGYFHSEFRRLCPFPGWGHDFLLNSDAANVPNIEKTAWNNNYVILETKGKGHYIGCNMSITNLKDEKSWWGEGDDMIWVDGYKWPPDLHGTGAEDYFNQAMGMQPNAYLRNGSSVYLGDTRYYQTSYVHHIENPVYFNKEIKVTIENGHANRLCNEVSSVAYWYCETPTKVIAPPPVEQRQPIEYIRGALLLKNSQRTGDHPMILTDDMKNSIKNWNKELELFKSGEKV